MAFKLFKDKGKNEIYLDLIEKKGDISVVAVDAFGRIIDKGFIISITPDGKLKKHRACGVPGIQTDSSEERILDYLVKP